MHDCRDGKSPQLPTTARRPAGQMLQVDGPQLHNGSPIASFLLIDHVESSFRDYSSLPVTIYAGQVEFDVQNQQEIPLRFCEIVR